MKKKTGIKSTIIIFAALVIVPLAWAQNPDAKQETSKTEVKDEGKEVAARFAAELKLTDQQREKLHASRQGRREKMQQLREAMRLARQALKEALKNPSVTRAGIVPLVARLKTLQGQLIDARVDHVLTLKEILTPEQFAKMQEAMKERRHNHKNRQGHLGSFPGKRAGGWKEKLGWGGSPKSRGPGHGRGNKECPKDFKAGPGDEEGL